MTIIDKKALIIKRIFIGVTALIVLLAVGFAARYFFMKENKVKTPAGETTSISNVEKNGTEKTGDSSPENKIESKFMDEYGECKKKFAGLDNMKTEEVEKLKADIVDINAIGARDYYVCLAVKNDDSKYCDAMKDNRENYAFCQNEYDQVSGLMFPALRSSSCDQKIIDACKRTGGAGSADCESICQGLYLGKVEECNKLKDGSPLKSACLAINKKEISPCSTLKEIDDEKICEEEYYFIRAVKENNQLLLEKIENIGERAIANLYFDKNYRCEKILAGFGENACSMKYNFDYLQTMKKSAESSQENSNKK
jgi:hypothetical protein